MRNLEECKAEIFRRSEERIRQRKNMQKRILMTGFSVFFVIGIYFSVILPVKKSEDMGMANEVEDVDSEYKSQSASIAFAYDRVEIKKGGYEKEITDKTEVLCIFETIYNFCYTDTVELQEEYEAKFKEQLEDACQQQEYTIIFSTDKGENSIYILKENELYQQMSGKVYRLTEEQICELKQYLHIE